MFSLATGVWILLVGYFAWRYPHWVLQLVAIVLPSYLLRLKIFGIPTTWLELTVYTVFIIWIWRGYLRAQWWRPLSLYWQPILLIGVGLIVGTVVSTDLFLSLGIIKGWFIDPLLLFILINNSVNRNHPETVFNYMILGLWFSGTILAVIALYQVISGNFITVDQRASAWFSSANYLSLYLVPIIVLVIGWWRNINTIYQKATRTIYFQKIIGGGLLLMISALYFTFSYAGWLALFLGVLVFWLLTNPIGKMGWLWLVGIGLIIISQLQTPKFQQMLDFVGRSSSHVRLQVWQTALLMIKEHWVTGIGLGLFEKRYLEFATKIFYPPIELLMLHTHNIIFQFWVNTGLIGVTGFIWLVGVFLSRLWRVVVLKHSLATIIFSAMVALLIHGLFDGAYWKNDLSMLFWIIIALGSILINQTNGRQKLSNRN